MTDTTALRKVAKAAEELVKILRANVERKSKAPAPIYRYAFLPSLKRLEAALRDAAKESK